MKKQLNYRELLNNWMQFYTLTAEASKRIFASIWTQIQSSKQKTNEEGVEVNGNYVECLDRKGEK